MTEENTYLSEISYGISGRIIISLTHIHPVRINNNNYYCWIFPFVVVITLFIVLSKFKGLIKGNVLCVSTYHYNNYE